MEQPKKEALTKTEGLVEMNWDPITRIIGSLGVYTKIDFKNKEVAECHTTSSMMMIREEILAS
jgi:hydrogenase large subunit